MSIDRSLTSLLERKSAMSSVPMMPTVCAMPHRGGTIRRGDHVRLEG